MGKYDDRPYAVGKGKPPKEYQFKPGQSGNPRGPKRRPNPRDATMLQLLAEVMNEPVVVTINGQMRTVPARLAIIMTVMRDALSSTPAQRLKVFNALNKVDAFNLIPSDRQPDPKSRDEWAHELVNALIAETGYDPETETFADPEFARQLYGYEPSGGEPVARDQS